MRKYDVQMALESIREKRQMWKDCHNTFNFNVNKVMRRLMHEAAANFMSVEEVAKSSGLKHAQVRQEMRKAGLDPREGKRVLSKTAAEALATNSDLLGIAPHEMDLMSPLAYLPAGSELRQAITDATTAGVTELPEDTVTVRADDLRLVLQAADYMNDRSLVGPVDRMGDALALVSGNEPAPEVYEHADAKQLAEKLTDAGPDYDHAREWINEVITRGVLIP